MQKDLEQIRITKEIKKRIVALSERQRLKQITVLEYLLSGKIDLKELNK